LDKGKKRELGKFSEEKKNNYGFRNGRDWEDEIGGAGARLQKLGEKRKGGGKFLKYRLKQKRWIRWSWETGVGGWDFCGLANVRTSGVKNKKKNGVLL